MSTTHKNTSVTSNISLHMPLLHQTARLHEKISSKVQTLPNAKELHAKILELKQQQQQTLSQTNTNISPPTISPPVTNPPESIPPAPSSTDFKFLEEEITIIKSQLLKLETQVSSIHELVKSFKDEQHTLLSSKIKQLNKITQKLEILAEKKEKKKISIEEEKEKTQKTESTPTESISSTPIPSLPLETTPAPVITNPIISTSVLVEEEKKNSS